PMLRLLLSLPTFFLLFLFHCFRAHRPLHSFPTRRSSDLSAFSPAKKYSVDQLKKDYSIYRNVLEEAHPGLYWYTSKDSMDYYFNWGEAQLADSMTEPSFRKVLAYVTAKINCGHTSVRPSKKWSKFQDTSAIWRVFPLSFKLWPDTAVVTGNLNRYDSILTRGTVITKLNGVPMTQLVDTMFKYVPT